MTSDTFIGAAHRVRMARMPKACAIKATAHQLARLIYAMLTQGKAYIEYGIDRFKSEHRNKQLRQLQRKAAQLGFVLTEKPALKMQHDHILGLCLVRERACRGSCLLADQELAGSPLPQFAFAQGVRNDFSTFSAASKPGWSSAYTENQTSAMLPSFNAT